LANGSYYQARSGLSPPSCCPCWAHTKAMGASSPHRFLVISLREIPLRKWEVLVFYIFFA